MKANVRLSVAVEMVYFGKWTGERFQGPHRSSPVLCSGAMCAPRRYTLLPAQSNDAIKTAHSYLTLICTWARAGAQPPTVRHRSFPRSGIAALTPAQPAKPAATFACAGHDRPETSKPSLQRTGRNSKLILLQRRTFGELRAAYRQLAKTLPPQSYQQCYEVEPYENS